jgi:hypothetical protein
MEDSDSDSDDAFWGFTHDDIPQEHRVGVPEEDDLGSSVSSVNTADLSDFPDNSGSESDEDERIFNATGIDITWRSRDFEPVEQNHFLQNSGAKLPYNFDSSGTPISFFNLFFPSHLIGVLVQNTNKYARWKRELKRATLRDPLWEDRLWPEDGSRETYSEEMQCFLGLQMLFGLNSRPQYKDYWSKNPYIGCRMVQRTMTLKRFEKLSQYFHVSDREMEPKPDNPNFDKLFKVRNILSEVQVTCTARYSPGQNQAIDEGKYLELCFPTCCETRDQTSNCMVPSF